MDPAPSVHRVPRHVWVLIALVVLILGFAIGGALRTAVASGSGAGPASAPGGTVAAVA